MEHSEKKQNFQRKSNKQTLKTKRKKQVQQRFFIIMVIVFALGFLAGLFVGINQEPEIQFVVPDKTSSEAAISEEIETDKYPKGLPWNLTLVNFENPLDETFVPADMSEADNGYIADSRITDAVKKMIADARSTENVRIIALSAYRDYEYQKELFDDKVQRLQQEKGYSVSKAREEAATVVAVPGTSEHQLGLALDLVDARHVKLDESQENTDAYKWLSKHCAEYGFIVRYPNGKTDITGIIYEPWHFRYVGVEAATYIMENGITLEEYLSDHYTP